MLIYVSQHSDIKLCEEPIRKGAHWTIHTREKDERTSRYHMNHQQETPAALFLVKDYRTYF